MNKNSFDKGFTLIEIVLAVLLFGILSTTLFFSYKSLFQARDVMDKKINLISESETALLRIIDDLTGFYCETKPLYKKTEEFNFESKYFFIAESVLNDSTQSTKLRFTSYSHLGFGKDNIKSPAEIFYFLKDDTLYRGDFPYPYPETENEKYEQSFPLCRNIKKFKLLFYDVEENEEESWNSDEGLYGYSTPYFVKIELEIMVNGEVEKYETELKLPVFREKDE